MDGSQYDARILDAAMVLKGAPPEAARKVARAFAQVSRAKAKVSGEGPAPRWFEVEARVAAARKVLTDAVDSWQRAVTEPAKQLARDAVAKVRDAVNGALAAARDAKSQATKWWSDVRDEVDKVIGTIGGAAAGAFAVAPLILVALFAFVLFQSSKHNA